MAVTIATRFSGHESFASFEGNNYVEVGFTLPSSLRDGDLIMLGVLVSGHHNDNELVTGPTGFTHIAGQNEGGSASLAPGAVK